jgi:hypothetical protein
VPEFFVSERGLEPVSVKVLVPGVPLLGLDAPGEIMLFHEFPESQLIGLAFLLGLIVPGPVLLQEFMPSPLGSLRGPALRSPATPIPAQLICFGVLEGYPVDAVGPFPPLLLDGFCVINPGIFLY